MKKIPSHKSDIYTVISTLFGIGFFPLLQGTIGTLVAALVYLFIPESWFYDSNKVYLSIVIIILMFFIGVYITRKAEAKLGHDAPWIIWDEFVGYYVSVILLPKSLVMAVYCFVIFRTFDIAKPWLIKQSQKLPHGWGIMTDDLLAGITTNIFMQIMILIYPKFFNY